MSLLLNVTPATTDAATVGFLLTPSATDTAQYIDAVTETFALTPSSTDIAAYVETGTEYLYLDIPSADHYDDFDDNSLDPKYWDDTGSFVFERNKRLEFDLPTTADVADVRSDLGAQGKRFNQTQIKVLSYSNPAGTRQLQFTVRGNPVQPSSSNEDRAKFVLTGSSLVATILDDAQPGNTVDSNSFSVPGYPLWLRIRRTFPGVVCEYSTDGTSWTPLASTANDYKWMRRTFTRIAISAGSGTGLQASFDDYVNLGNQIDVAQFTDAQTELLKFTPSGTEQRISEDADTELFKFTPSGVDDYTPGVVEYTDANTENLALIPSATEVAEFADASTETFILSPSATDVAVLVDSATQLLNLVPSGDDVAQYTETAIESFLLVPSGSDILGAIDSQIEIFSLQASSADIAGYVDSGREDFVLSASGTELAQFVESATEDYKLTPSADESMSGLTTDAATELFSLFASATEYAEFVDSNTESLQLLVTGTELSTFVDLQTGTITFIPSHADVLEAVDAITEIFRLTPSATEIGPGAANIDAATLDLQLIPGGFEYKILVELAGRLFNHYMMKGEKVYSARHYTHMRAKLSVGRLYGSITFRRWFWKEG